jgi:hypothetical protein
VLGVTIAHFAIPEQDAASVAIEFALFVSLAISSRKEMQLVAFHHGKAAGDEVISSRKGCFAKTTWQWI